VRAEREMLFAIRLPSGYHWAMNRTDLDILIYILELVVILLALAEGALNLVERVKKRKR
jgi:hypothetical protein